MSVDHPFQSEGELPTDTRELELQPGVQIEQYELVEFVGRGGGGQIWKAVCKVPLLRDLTEFVVLKFHPDPQSQATAALIAAQYMLVRRIKHPNISLSMGLTSDQRFGLVMIMEYFDGQTLLEYRRILELQEPKQRISCTMDILSQVANALDFLHEHHRIIHRDIKPENILVSHDGRMVQLIDFGLAAHIDTDRRRTLPRAIVGTIAYSSPEQLSGLSQNGASDQYALGAVAYELLTGRLPYSNDRIDMLRLQIQQDALPQSTEISPVVYEVLARALSKKPEDRFSTCGEFVKALRKALIIPEEQTLEKVDGASQVGETAISDDLRSQRVDDEKIGAETGDERPTHLLIVLADLISECGPDLNFLAKFSGEVIIRSQELEQIVSDDPELGAELWASIADIPNVHVVEFSDVNDVADPAALLEFLLSDDCQTAMIRSWSDWCQIVLRNVETSELLIQEQSTQMARTKESPDTGSRKMDKKSQWHPAMMVGRKPDDVHVRMFVDTSSMMTKHFEAFALQYFEDWAKVWADKFIADGKSDDLRVPVVFPIEVLRELESLAKNGESSKAQDSARKAILVLGKLIEKDALVPFESSIAYEKQAADDVFIATLPSFLLEHDVILLTQDKALAESCQNMYDAQVNSQAHTGRKRRFAVCRLVEDKSKQVRMVSHFPASNGASNSKANSTSNKANRTKDNNTNSAPSSKKKSKALVEPAKKPTFELQALNQTLIPVKSFPTVDSLTMSDRGETYRIGREIDRGGEGKIFEVFGQPELVAKIYHPEHLVQWRIDKLQRMIANPVKNKGVAWPIELLFNEASQPVGFTMPKVVGAIPIENAVYNILEIEKHFPSWTRKELVILAKNLASVIRILHDRNNVIGDLNPANVLICVEDNLPRVTLVDADSWQFEGYPSPVSKDAFLHPALHGQRFVNVLRERVHDEYALAVMIFQILYFGRHPYDSTAGKNEVTAMREYDFPYPLRNNEDAQNVPRGIPWRIWTHLDFPVQKAFHDIFAAKQTVTAKEWVEILDKYCEAIVEDRLDVLGNANRIVPEQSRVPKQRNGAAREFRCQAHGCQNTEVFFNAVMIQRAEANRHFLCRKCKEEEARQSQEGDSRICGTCSNLYSLPVWFEEMLAGKYKLPTVCPSCAGPGPAFKCQECRKSFSVYDYDKWKLVQDKAVEHRLCNRCMRTRHEAFRNGEVRRDPPPARRNDVANRLPPPKQQAAPPARKAEPRPQPAPKPKPQPTPPAAQKPAPKPQQSQKPTPQPSTPPQKSLMGKLWSFLTK
jgi:serine/threonine protein kinase